VVYNIRYLTVLRSLNVNSPCSKHGVLIVNAQKEVREDLHDVAVLLSLHLAVVREVLPTTVGQLEVLCKVF
jgi:hypothetical protein